MSAKTRGDARASIARIAMSFMHRIQFLILLMLLMENQMMLKPLLDKHYETLSAKGQADTSLSEDFLLTGTVDKEARGRGAFADSLFFRYVKSLKAKTMIIDGWRACAVVVYELAAPSGDRLSCEAAEVWEMKDGKLASLAMYFDTAAYQKFMLPILFPLTRLKKKSGPLSR
jgi:ketosteroid isomerase-like protein